MPHREEVEKKTTVRLKQRDYNPVSDALYHGQMSMLFRNIFKSLSIKITSGRIKEITNYIYGEASLTLDKVTPVKPSEKD